MAVLNPQLQSFTMPHVHIGGEQCPWCEQPIPNEKYEEISARIAAKERQRQAELEAKSKAEIEAVRKQGLAALEAVKAEVAAREATAREQGKKLAESAYQTQLTEAAEAAKSAIEREASMKSQLQESRSQLMATVQKMNTEFAAKEAAIRAETKSAVEASYSARVAETENARQLAEKKLAELQASQEAALNARLQEQREALEKHNQATLNAERAKAFEEKQKLESALQDVQRQLQKKTAEELGEGAEVDLFEELKAEFPGDKIRRVQKGTPGADVIHEIYNNGMLCGTVVYDSKNRSAWRTEYVTKLRADQIAAKADHAVLSSHAFPAGVKQLHIQDGVIVVNPARALVIATLLRKHVVQTYGLRVSNEERTNKTEALYAFITSDRCTQFLDDISTSTEDMEELDVKEKKAHDATWKKRGELIRSVQRSRGQLCDEIERIIGTAK
jgi:hypothetical protein